MNLSILHSALPCAPWQQFSVCMCNTNKCRCKVYPSNAVGLGQEEDEKEQLTRDIISMLCATLAGWTYVIRDGADE